MSSIKAKIVATARSLPENIMTNHDLEKIVDTSDDWIQSRTGIKQRHVVGENEASSDISTKIALTLLEKSQLSPTEIDVIIVGTVTPDHFTPSTAAIVQNNINAKNAWGFDLSAACSGFIYGLETGSSLIKSGKYNNVMVIGVDTMTSILDFQDRDTCVIFGDGGGGVILQPTKNNGIIDSLLHMDGSGGEYLIIPGGGSKIPASVKSVENRDHFIKQDGKTVFKHAVRGMADVSSKILKNNNLTGNDISLFIPHQANKRIIDAAAERCGISKERVLINIGKYGNTTAGTIPIALSEAVDDGKIKNGDYVLLSSFGAGFTWGSILLKWED
ncbi:MAG: ketoacyl-ACP synthase III [Candidatus Marinimicrobia bacterium]|jgi:3-oxoacyl-[acyl-carrier-protein] synthase-3|nr:ketoacyl-ACP synthase III [Candidatus Neomarinimicrobiota bacterium]